MTAAQNRAQLAQEWPAEVLEIWGGMTAEKRADWIAIGRDLAGESHSEEIKTRDTSIRLKLR